MIMKCPLIKDMFPQWRR